VFVIIVWVHVNLIHCWLDFGNLDHLLQILEREITDPYTPEELCQHTGVEKYFVSTLR